MMHRRDWAVARVLEYRPGRVRLRFSRVRDCRQCLSGRGCGAGVFGRLFPSSPVEIELPWRESPGDHRYVRVGIDRRAMVSAAVRAWGLPLIAFVGVLWVCSTADAAVSEGMALLSALLAGGLAFRIGTRGSGPDWNPELVPLSSSADRPVRKVNRKSTSCR